MECTWEELNYWLNILNKVKKRLTIQYNGIHYHSEAVSIVISKVELNMLIEVLIFWSYQYIEETQSFLHIFNHLTYSKRIQNMLGMFKYILRKNLEIWYFKCHFFFFKCRVSIPLKIMEVSKYVVKTNCFYQKFQCSVDFLIEDDLLTFYIFNLVHF